METEENSERRERKKIVARRRLKEKVQNKEKSGGEYGRGGHPHTIKKTKEIEKENIRKVKKGKIEKQETKKESMKKEAEK